MDLELGKCKSFYESGATEQSVWLVNVLYRIALDYDVGLLPNLTF